MKKEVLFESNARKEFDAFPIEVQEEFWAQIKRLSRDGQLREPEAKKLTKDLSELRVNQEEAWRAIYAYFTKEYIVILVCFGKKTQKTPDKYIDLAYKRLSRL